MAVEAPDSLHKTELLRRRAQWKIAGAHRIQIPFPETSANMTTVINHKLFFAVSAFASTLVLIPLLIFIRQIGFKRIGLYALGFFVTTLAVFLYAGWFNDHTSYFSLGNYVLTLGVAIQTIGIRKFYYRPSLWLLIVPCTLISEFLLFWFLRINPNYPNRLTGFTFFLFIFVLIQFLTVIRYSDKSFISRLLSASLAIECLVYLIRCGTLFIPSLVPADPAAFSLIQLAYIFVFSTIVPLTAICLMINGSHLLQEKSIFDAKTKNQQKTETLGYISHDLRAPLATISGYTSLLLNDATDAQRKSLLSIQRNIDYQLGLIDELQAFSKVELQPLTIQPTAIDLPLLLNDISEYTNSLCSLRKNSFCYQPPDGLPRMVHLDGKRLQQVLLNLLSNATKFTHDGMVTLSVTAEPKGDICVLHFAVSDTGIGIDLSQNVDIFGAFQQIQATSGSTGLGLFIAQRIVSAMGGSLSVASTPGEGSTFSFELSAPVVTAPNSGWSDIGPPLSATPPRPLPQATREAPQARADIDNHIGDEALDELANLALHGRFTDIEHWIERHIKEAAHSPFADALRDLLDQFDFPGIHALTLRSRSHSNT